MITLLAIHINYGVKPLYPSCLNLYFRKDVNKLSSFIKKYKVETF